MASPGLCPQFETNLMSNRKVIELLLQLKSAKARGKNYIKVEPHLARHLLRNRLFVEKKRNHLQPCLAKKIWQENDSSRYHLTN